jgi:hypothetical protein
VHSLIPARQATIAVRGQLGEGWSSPIFSCFAGGMKKRLGKARSLPDLPSLASVPEVRLVNATAMKAEWVDPDDVTPSTRRTAKTVTRYRSYCPLHRSMHKHGTASTVTAKHVAAADELRRLADLVAVGCAGRKDVWLPIQAMQPPGPLTGHSLAAIRQAKAWPAYRRAMALFSKSQRELITYIVLLNWSVTRWVGRLREQGLTGNMAIETGKLVAILDVLAEHLSSEIERHG